MTEREQLIEILRKPIFPHELVDPTEAVADYLMDNGVTLQRWIPVTERLPEKRGSYLATIRLFYNKVRTGEAVWNGKRWGDICHNLPLQVTHWMPLPEPPKEEIGLNDTVIVEKEGDQGGQ